MLRHRVFVLATIVALTSVVACGGGGSDPVNDGGGGSSLISADFTPSTPNPGADMVTLQKGTANANNVVVDVRVTDVNGVFGASFDVLYNTAQAAFVGYTAGDALAGGNTPLYDVQQPTPGRLVVFATRQGAGATGVDITGTKTLIKLTFRVDRAGSSTMSFQNGELLDDQNPPQPIPGIAWSGGTLTGA